MEEQKIVNGVNVTQLFNTIELIKEKPDMAKFDPTERSMPPAATTISSASTTRPPSVM